MALDALKTPDDLRDRLTSVLRPTANANGLPSACYTDPSVFALETRALFHAGWAAIGFAHRTPEAGDAVPLDHLGAPLLQVRDREGRLRVFENVCRHRGVVLVEEPRKFEGAIRCPYHSWCYALDGRLVATPHVGGPGVNVAEGVDRETLGLIEVASRVWLGVVFVNLDGSAPPFEEAHGPLMARWSEFERDIRFGAPDSGFQLDVACNWKLAVENYSESYHLPWVHPGLNSYSRLEDHYNITEDDAYSGQGTLVYRPSLDAEGRAFTPADDLSDKWDSGAEYVTAFPNVLFGVHKDHVFAVVLEPRGPGRTIEHMEIGYLDAASAGPDYEDLRRANSALWRAVFEEDVGVVESMQRGRGSVGFDGGRFSPAMDPPTHLFHSWAARRLIAAIDAS